MNYTMSILGCLQPHFPDPVCLFYHDLWYVSVGKHAALAFFQNVLEVLTIFLTGTELTHY